MLIISHLKNLNKVHKFLVIISGFLINESPKNMPKLKMNRIKFLQLHPTNVTEISPIYINFFVYNLAIGPLYSDVLLGFHVI
jgi:hypothetical protein